MMKEKLNCRSRHYHGINAFFVDFSFRKYWLRRHLFTENRAIAYPERAQTSDESIESIENNDKRKLIVKQVTNTKKNTRNTRHSKLTLPNLQNKRLKIVKGIPKETETMATQAEHTKWNNLSANNFSPRDGVNAEVTKASQITKRTNGVPVHGVWGFSNEFASSFTTENNEESENPVNKVLSNFTTIERNKNIPQECNIKTDETQQKLVF